MTETTRAPNVARSSDAQDALSATAQAIDSTRQLASNTAARIGESARDMRNSAADYARTSAESVSEAAEAAQRRVGKLAQAARQHVEEAPMKAVLIAAGVGAVVALLLGSLRSKPEAD